MAASFLDLPPELIQCILSFVPATGLATLAQTCRLIHEHTLNDQLWQARVQESLPGTKLDKAYPAASFRELYLAHHPYLFLPKYKLWFSDSRHTGQLLLARYSHTRQTIEAYALAAKRGSPNFQFWSWNREVIIHTFEPKVRLDLGAPVLRLTPDASRTRRNGRPQHETPMNIPTLVPVGSLGGISSEFMHTRSLSPDAIGTGTSVWPPMTLPALTRTRNASSDAFRSSGHRPSKPSEVSESTFRIRRAVNFSQHGGMRRVGEVVHTFATLPPECYTPTKQKPWRGIWCGDYSGHGCEFMVVLQPDEPQELPDDVHEALERSRRSNSPDSDRSWQTALTSVVEGEASLSDMEHFDLAEVQSFAESRQMHEKNLLPLETVKEETEYSGQLMAIKLTGDPNIPRGEYTFISPELGDQGLVRVADEPIFRGARVVRSVGHIAAEGYIEDGYIPSQLILVSHDTLAQYWQAFGHVSFYKRVDIDKFLHAD